MVRPLQWNGIKLPSTTEMGQPVKKVLRRIYITEKGASLPNPSTILFIWSEVGVRVG